MKWVENKIEYLLFVFAIFLFVPFLGNVHLFDWDEINFAEASREMLASGNYAIVQIDYMPFWEKPPFFFWLQALSMKVFGVNEFAARFPNALCGAFTVLALFRIGKKLFNVNFGLIWVLAYIGSLLPFFYFKSGIIDPWFNLFIFLSIWHLYLYLNKHPSQLLQIVASSLFLGFAVLTKGPVAILIVGLCYSIYLLFNRFKNVPPLKHLFLYFAVVLSIGGIWFFALLLNGNYGIISEFILYQIRLFNTQDAGHGGPFYYHFIVLLAGCFPASIFAIPYLKKDYTITLLQQSFHYFMLLLFWVVLILFSIVKTKIVHYSSLCYFPLTFFAAISLYKLFYSEKKIFSTTVFLIALIGLSLSLILTAVPFIEILKPFLMAQNIPSDEFGKEAFKTSVNWSGIESIGGVLLCIGIFFFLYYRKRKISKAVLLLFFASLLSTSLAMLLIAPKVEPYSQGAAIEFYKSKRNEECFILPLGFKSYAHLFYAQKKPGLNPPHYSEDWALNGDTNIPVYCVVKINRSKEYENYYPQLEKLYEKNGFTFYKKRN